MTTIALPRAGTHRHHYRTRVAGEHALRLSLLSLLVGVPAAALVWRIWSLVFVGPSAGVGPQAFDGWGRVAVQLPGTLLVVAVATAAVVLAAQAAAARVEHAPEVLGLGSLGLLVVLQVIGTTVLHTVQGAPSGTATWGVRAAALGVAGLVWLASSLWALDARR